MENEKQPLGNQPPRNDNKNVNPQPDGQQENVFDDDNSAGKNALGENPEQILYDNPDNVEEADQIISDGND